MHERCLSKAHPANSSYQNREICERWLNNFEAFYQDMGDRPEGMSLERINNDLGYSPENCKWATAKDQQRNRRSSRLIEAFGVSMTLAQWAEKTGLNPVTISNRIRAGKTNEQAMSLVMFQYARKVNPEGAIPVKDRISKAPRGARGN